MKKITNYLIATCLGLTTALSVNASNSTTATSLNTKEDSNTTAQKAPMEPCYAATVVKFWQGKTNKGKTIGTARSHSELALGMPDKSNAKGGFVSLGQNGYIVLGFSGAVYDAPGVDIKVYETSYSGDTCGRQDDEKAMIYLSQNGMDWVSYGEICRDGDIDIAGSGLSYVAYIKIMDNASTTPDGYDVDGVEAVNGCYPIPMECYGSKVVNYMPSDSNGAIKPARMNPENGLGKPQGGNTNNFVTLGYGGSITIGFDEVVYNHPGNDITIVETTHGNYTYASYPESADVYVSQNGVDFYMIGSVITKQSASLDFDAAPLHLDYITMVKLVDTTPMGSKSDDGFDLDGIVAINGCSPKPEVKLGGCNASELVKYEMGTAKGGGSIDPIRTDPMKALWSPEGTDQNVFYTIGYDGSITLAFDGAIMNGPGADLQFIETSFNQTMGCTKYPEFADIYVSADNYSWHMAGTVCKEDNTVDISVAGDFEYIYYVKVVNNNTLSKTPDAYDLDGVIALYNCVEQSKDDNNGSMGKKIESRIKTTSYQDARNGTVNISFVSPERSRGQVEIYDMFGQSVGKVFNNSIDSDKEYNVDFDGSSLAPGMYVYKVTIGNKTVTKKFIINRR